MVALGGNDAVLAVMRASRVSGGSDITAESLSQCHQGDRFLKSDASVLILHLVGAARVSKRPGEDDKQLLLKGLILAQNERWRRGLGMQVERIPVL